MRYLRSLGLDGPDEFADLEMGIQRKLRSCMFD